MKAVLMRFGSTLQSMEGLIANENRRNHWLFTRWVLQEWPQSTNILKVPMFSKYQFFCRFRWMKLQPKSVVTFQHFWLDAMNCFLWRDKLSVILDTSIRKAIHGEFEPVGHLILSGHKVTSVLLILSGHKVTSVLSMKVDLEAILVIRSRMDRLGSNVSGILTLTEVSGQFLVT